jgi:hypothetical protein
LTASISLVCGQLFSSLFFFDFHRTNLRIPPDLSPVSIRLALLLLLLTRGARCLLGYCRLSTGRKPATTTFGTFLSIHTDENGLIEKAGQSTPSLISCALFMNGVTRFLRAQSRFDPLPPGRSSSGARGLKFTRHGRLREHYSKPWPGGSMPDSSIQRFRRPFLGSSSTRSGRTAARAASMFVTAIASMMSNDVPTWTAKRGSCVIASCCIALAKPRQQLGMNSSRRLCSEVHFQLHPKWRF